MSQIDVDDLNEYYPIKGKDNDTQGFRDNFSNIKKNLRCAKEELEALYDSTIKKESDNDFGGNVIKNANLSGCTEMYVNGGVLLDDFKIDVTIGHYQSYQVDDDVLISLENWPAGRYMKVIVELTGASNKSKNVQFKGPNFDDNIRYDVDWPNPDTEHRLVLDQNNTHIVEFWSANGGVSVFSKYIGRF